MTDVQHLHLPFPVDEHLVPAEIVQDWQAAHTDTQRSRVLESAVRLLRMQDFTATQTLAETALELAFKDGAPAEAAEAMLHLSNLAANQNDYVRSLKYCEQALHIVQEHHLQSLECRLLNTRALPRLWIGDEIGARRDMQRALKLARPLVHQLGDSRRLLTSCVNGSWIALLSSRPDLSEHYLNLLEETIEQLPDEQQAQEFRTYLYENRAHTQLLYAQQAQALNRPQAVQDAVQEGLRNIPLCHDLLPNVTTPEKRAPFLMMLESHQANFLLLLGQPDAAEQHARAALNHNTHKDVGIIPHAHKTLAAVHVARHEWDAALKQYGQALSIVRGSGRYRETQEFLHAIARIHEQRGDYKAAYEATQDALQEAQQSMQRLTEFEDQQFVLDDHLSRSAETLSSWQDRLRQAEQMARLDALTGLLNRRGLNEHLHQLQHDPPSHTDARVLVAFIDIDHFKSVNDEFSHATGDEVLQVTAQLLKQTAPPSSLIARYGGEEFILTLSLNDPQTQTGTLWNLLEHCRAAIEQHDWTPLLKSRTLTISIGYSVGNPSELPNLLHRADEHLYQAKRSGRNRVCCPQHPPTLQGAAAG